MSLKGDIVLKEHCCRIIVIGQIIRSHIVAAAVVGIRDRAGVIARVVVHFDLPRTGTPGLKVSVAVDAIEAATTFGKVLRTDSDMVHNIVENGDRPLRRVERRQNDSVTGCIMDGIIVYRNIVFIINV